MNDKQIEQLLTAFYNGTTTEEEERKLNAFFMQGEVSERWRDEQKCVEALMDAEQVPIPQGLATRLESRIDTLAGSGKGYTLRKRILLWVGSAAAVALLCFCFYAYNIPRQPKQPFTDTFTDPHDAALAAGKALAMMSVQLNKGVKQVNDAEKEIDNINRILNKNLINK